MQTRDSQIFFDKYSILSLLAWSRMEHEPPFGMNLINHEYVPESMPSSVQIKNMTISSTKSQIILRTVSLNDLRCVEPGVP